eukprot:TRINITY_DN11979_c0_g1_i5.p1 TRINITY_DN11979_c0_g1~~TRINITY_DN11979_c0_g1_i5.p1  ORF type:complete len:180 (+),score=42.75 TRINITY_DN11979_c0_g1_i5:100-639(+)
MSPVGRCVFFFFQAEDGIRDVERSRGLGDVYKRQGINAEYMGDLEIELPYKFIRRFQEYPMEDKAELEKIVIVAGRFCNDTFLKPICLYYHPILIAGGCLYMSMLYHQKSLPDFSGKPWYKFLLPEIELPHIQEVTNVIKEMFQLIEKDLMGKKPEKPPAPVETKKQSQSIYYLSLIHI